MISHKRFNALIALFPIVYLIHNLEEWFLFSRKINTIAELTPNFIKGYIVDNSSFAVTIFGNGLIIATLIPLVVTFLVWDKPNTFNLKLLTVIAFATFINGLSHISTSLALGIIAPGLTTGMLLCIPVSILVFFQVYKNHRFNFKEYSLFLILSILVYVFAIAFSWITGYGIYKLIE